MCRVIVVGSGIAGLTAALRLAGAQEVILVTKGHLGESNTAWAQGGIAGVIGTTDTVDSHLADTLSAGAGHCDSEAAAVLCAAGGEALIDLAEAGVDFDMDPTGTWARGMEGAHSHPRIFHAGGDTTGRAIIAALSARLRAEVAAERITLLEQTMLVDIVTEADGSTDVTRPNGATRSVTGTEVAVTSGVTVLRAGCFETLAAEAVVLATGGAGQLFAHTTNPQSATGDGLAAAIRAGAAVRDLEFFQFHPTALAGSGFLISEAVRGAGALLVDEQGRRFMLEVDERAELAPRDVVALALHRRSAAQEGRPCFLDARAIPDVAARFPSITAGLAAQGLDPARDLIPVLPAAHYFMGGVATDADGRTSIGGLFAVGEVACTGAHGANRLASNSLLEGAVFAARTAAAIDAELTNARASERARTGGFPLPHLTASPQAGLTGSELSRSELQRLAWDHLGVERTATGLTALIERLGETVPTSSDAIGIGRLTLEDSANVGVDHARLVDQIETANLALIAAQMAAHALAREDSLGAHTRTDTSSNSAPTPPTTTSTSTAELDSSFAPPTALLQEATAC